MRGIVTLAAALALPPAFPYRDLIVLTSFFVVLGTLVIQGLTLKPLLRALNLRDDDPVGCELSLARQRVLTAGLANFSDDNSPAAQVVRHEFTARLSENPMAGEASHSAHSDLHRKVLAAARQTLLSMRASDEIGDDSFHQMEEELDWIEMAGRSTNS